MKNNCFPIVFNGIFSDEINWEPIFQYELGELLLEIDYNGSITEWDNKVKEMINKKTIPNNIILTRIDNF